MNIPITVNYKFKNIKICNDLVCSLTEYFDTYLLKECKYCNWYKCYLYNDLVKTNKGLCIMIRLPGCTVGCIYLVRLSEHTFRISDIYFDYDYCFGKYVRFKKELLTDSNRYIGRVLDFCNVELINNV